jgi:hypothetical protein
MEFERECDDHHKKAKLLQISDIFLTFASSLGVEISSFHSIAHVIDKN